MKKLEGYKKELILISAKRVRADLAEIRAKKRHILNSLIKKSDQNKIARVKKEIEGIE